MAKKKFTTKDCELNGAAKADFDHLVSRLEETLWETRAPSLRSLDRLAAIAFVTHLCADTIAMPCNQDQITKTSEGVENNEDHS